MQTETFDLHAKKAVGYMRREKALPQGSEIITGCVSTGSGSDLVSDRHSRSKKDFGRQRLDQVATLPVLTRSKCESYFVAKPCEQINRRVRIALDSN